MLCYNDSDNLKASLDSLIEFGRLQPIEIVVVDNYSTDGSWETLKDYSFKNGITTLQKKCKRGAGRQTALMQSHGDYILGQMDCDDVFSPSGLNSLVRAYHEHFEGKLMMTTTTSNITIGPRTLIMSLGGWRDLNWWEEWDLWARAASKGKYACLPYPDHTPPHVRIIDKDARRIALKRERFRTRYERYRDAIRIGKRAFAKDEPVSPSQRLIYTYAKLAVILQRSRLEPVPDPDFQRYVSSV